MFRGADLGNTDQRLVVAKICLKLKFQKVEKRIATLNLSSLDTLAIKDQYVLEIKNHLESLSQLLDIEAMWDSFETEVTNAC